MLQTPDGKLNMNNEDNDQEDSFLPNPQNVSKGSLNDFAMLERSLLMKERLRN